MPTKTKPEMFTDVEFMTAADKRKVLKQWRAFVAAAFAYTRFTKAIYQHLNLHGGGFIAEYNIDGFYNAWFTPGAARQRFISVFLAGGPAGYGLREGDYSDINNAMANVLREVSRRLLAGARRDERARLLEARSSIDARLAVLDQEDAGESVS